MRRRPALIGGLALYVLTWLGNRSLRRVEGGSMRPTLAPDDLVLVAPTRLLPLRRGAVVVVPDPRDGRPTIKRVAALPGGTVTTDGRELRAGPGEVVVLGDDPSASTDSRTYGAVPVGSVRAVAVVALRPWRRLGPTPARHPTGTP